MTSQSLVDRSLTITSSRKWTAFRRIGLPVLCFLATMFTTTAVGMRYMRNFRLGIAPLATDTDILPFAWIVHHLRYFASGFPFSLTLIGILLAHEFGHYFACRRYAVRATLPYLLPAPSLSGTLGAIIRLQSAIRSRSALIVIGASGPIAGFVVALGTIAVGFSLSKYADIPSFHGVAAPLTISVIHHLQHQPPLALIIPHPVLIASWIGLLITSLNLMPAGQLDGGHIVYAISPQIHRWSSRFVVAGLLALGIFSWAGWLIWAFILMMPGMRHPRVLDTLDLPKWQYALLPVTAAILIVTGTLQPFQGYSVLDFIRQFAA